VLEAAGQCRSRQLELTVGPWPDPMLLEQQWAAAQRFSARLPAEWLLEPAAGALSSLGFAFPEQRQGQSARLAAAAEPAAALPVGCTPAWSAKVYRR